MEGNAKETWSKAWPSALHKDAYAKKRIESAKSAKMTPIRIDENDNFGYFQGSNGKYETFLDECSCTDFIRNKRPCKHIYRLAMELGLMNSKFDSDASKIPIPKSDKLSLDETFDIVEALPIDAQHRLLDIAREYESGSHLLYELEDENLKVLLKSGLIVECPGERKKLKIKSVGALKAVLVNLGLPFDNKMKAAELREFCNDNYYAELSNNFPVLEAITFAPNVTARNIHFYLNRKLYASAHSENNNPDIYTGLPDDAITKQLIKRGYFPPDIVSKRSKDIVFTIKCNYTPDD